MGGKSLKDETLVRFAFDFARRVAGHDADAEDLAQEALLEFAEAGPSPVPARAFVGRRIVLGAKMLRRANLTRARHERAASVEGVVGSGEEGAEAREALALLDTEDRHAVELRFLHGLSYAEVAHVLGISEPAARMRVHRALGALRARLGPRAESMIAALPLFLAPRSLGPQTALAAALAGGGIAMKKIIVAVVLVLAVVGGGVATSRAMRSAPPSRAEPQLAATAAVAPAPEASATEPAAPEAPSISVPEDKADVIGRVTFADGEPLRRVALTLYGARPTGTVTDDEGRFRLRTVKPGDQVLCAVQRKDSFVALARAPLKAGETVQLDIALQRGTLLEGTVMKGGAPVSNATVALERPAARATGTVQGAHGTCMTDAEGTFAFPYLPDGLYTLVVSRYGIETGYAEVDVKPGMPPVTITVKDARPLRIRLSPMPASLLGKQLSFLVSSFGKPVSAFWTLAPDERGVITVPEAPPPGKYMLYDLPGGPREFVVTEADVPEVVIDLSRFGRVVGTVSSPCGVRVGSSLVKTEGPYEIDLVPPGEAKVTVYAGGAEFVRPPIDVPASAEIRLDIELRGVTVRGRFVGKAPHGSGGIVLRRADRSEFAQTRPDDAGRFAIPFVEPGAYEVVAWTSDDPRGQSRPIAVGGEDLDVGDVVIEPGVEVPVVVAVPAGARVAGSWQLFAWEDGKGGSQVTLALDESGKGKVRLRPGRWRLTLRVGDLREATVEVDIPVASPVRFELGR